VSDAENHVLAISHLPSLSFISFDNIDTYTIAPPVGTPLGSSIITVTIDDGNLKNTETFKITVASRPPVFNDGTISLSTMNVGVVTAGKTLVIPPYNDPDGEAVTFLFEDQKGAPLPTWMQITNANTLLEVVPPSFSDIGDYNVKIVLKTPNEQVFFPFTIAVTNTAPEFVVNPPESMIVFLNEIKMVDIKDTYKDNEEHAVSVTYYYTKDEGKRNMMPAGIFSLVG
jgi:hypothetical protein